MNLLSRRYLYSDASTISHLFVDDDPHPFCQILELSCRRGDEKGLLAASEGRYRVNFAHWKKYGRDYPILQEVPRADGKGFRTGIFIHPANYPSQLDGCLAPGIYDPLVPDFIGASRSTFDRLFKRMKEAEEPIWINIIGGLPPLNRAIVL